jgi:hypothetical protein
MSYVQGTKVELSAVFTDTKTGEPITPTEVILTISPPAASGIPTYERRLSVGDVVADPDVEGRVTYLLDTSPATGTWRYQFASTGNQAVVGRQELTVRSRLAAA